MAPETSRGGVVDWTKASVSAIRDMLRELRKYPERKSTQVYYGGSSLLERAPRSLGDEKWPVYEQMFLATLDCNLQEDAEHYLALLEERFPASKRVAKLHGMLLESRGRFEEATAHYQDMLENDAADRGAARRLVAIEKAKGNTRGAIEELSRYLTIYQVDEEAWSELADLYCSEGNFRKAASCYEELILQEPQNYLSLLQYGEVLYTQGGAENLRLARKYVAQSINLNSDVKKNLRAHYVLWSICTALTAEGGAEAAQAKVMLTWLRGRLQPLAATSAPVKALLAAK